MLRRGLSALLAKHQKETGFNPAFPPVSSREQFTTNPSRGHLPPSRLSSSGQPPLHRSTFSPAFIPPPTSSSAGDCSKKPQRVLLSSDGRSLLPATHSQVIPTPVSPLHLAPFPKCRSVNISVNCVSLHLVRLLTAKHLPAAFQPPSPASSRRDSLSGDFSSIR